MFYSRLRWKIKDLKDEATKLKLEVLERGRLLGLWQQRCHVAEGDVRYLEKKISALQNEFDNARMTNDKLSCDLIMTEEQLTSANEEIKRLLEENDYLRELLRKKGGCPCDKRRKH